MFSFNCVPGAGREMPGSLNLRLNLWMTAVATIGRPKSVHNCCVIGIFCSAFVLL